MVYFDDRYLTTPELHQLIHEADIVLTGVPGGCTLLPPHPASNARIPPTRAMRTRARGLRP